MAKPALVRQPAAQQQMPFHSPQEVLPDYQGSGKLNGKVAMITGGDSGIGRSVAILFAKEGADVAILYFKEEADARRTRELVEAEGRRFLAFAGDVGDERFCRESVEEAVRRFGRLDILVNNAAEQHVSEELEEISAEQLERTFRTNIFGYFYMSKAALRHLQPGSCIINTTSITAFRGKAALLDYSSTKGAIVAFTRSLAQSLAGKRIRVNAVAPGPVWTPLIPGSFDEQSLGEFGKDTFLERAAEPSEIAPSFVFLACNNDSLFMNGQVLHPNGAIAVTG